MAGLSSGNTRRRSAVGGLGDFASRMGMSDSNSVVELEKPETSRSLENRSLRKENEMLKSLLLEKE